MFQVHRQEIACIIYRQHSSRSCGLAKRGAGSQQRLRNCATKLTPLSTFLRWGLPHFHGTVLGWEMKKKVTVTVCGELVSHTALFAHVSGICITDPHSGGLTY